MTIRQWKNDALARLTGAEAEVECRWMLADALGVSPARLPAMQNDALTDAQLEVLSGWLDARARGVPLAYAQKRAYFMGHEFAVDRRVLIPRQDTEILCEQAIKRARRGLPDVLEVCTGSGAVAISIALAAKGARVTATDLSEGALAVARMNARRLGANVEFRAGDLFGAIGDRRFDLIVCNPPYLTERDMAALSPEVQKEPALALLGGADGLDFYRRIARDARDHLTDAGALLFEVGAGQARAVRDMLDCACSIYEDYQHIERVLAFSIGEMA